MKNSIAAMTATALALTSTTALAQIPLAGCSSSNAFGSSDKTHMYFFNDALAELHGGALSAAFVKANYSTLEGNRSSSDYLHFSAYTPHRDIKEGVFARLDTFLSDQGLENEGLSGQQLFELIKSDLDGDEIRSRVGVLVGASPVVETTLTDTILDLARQEMLDALAFEISEDTSPNASHENYFVSDVLSGKRVIALSHGHGYAAAVASLRATEIAFPTASGSLALIGVAPTTDDQFNNSFYRTAVEDDVVEAVRRYRQTLAPNATASQIGSPGDPWTFSHSFEQGYLSTATFQMRNDIDAELDRLGRDLAFPLLAAGDGAMRATLVWDDQPDVDLHVFEPAGGHVFYANPVGLDGTLDVDDISGFGPENYFVPCDRVRAGIYEIGVNYYSGFAPTTATVSLFLGDGRTPSPRTITLNTPLGGSGDATPTVLFRVNVTDDNGIARYTVEQVTTSQVANPTTPRRRG